MSDVTQFTPYFLHYGRRARLPLSKLLPDQPLLDDRLQDVANALRDAAAATAQSRHYNRERLAQKANTQSLKVGDCVIVKAQEPLTLTSKWDPQWTITRVKGKVVWITHQQSGKQKTLNVNKVRLVDPNIAWDELNPRPIRQQGHGPRQLQQRQLQPPSVPFASLPPRQMSSGQGAGSRVTEVQRPAKRRRGDDQHANDVTRTNTGSGTQARMPAYKQPRQDSTSQQSTRLNQPPRPSTSTAKRTIEGDHQAAAPPKRARTFLPRGAKRPLPEELIPTPDQQKRARIAAISLVQSFLA